ncbi:MAG: UDP-N-acetylmuramoyl-tripeptide--D-alanyl-D-alanine ligase [Solirubrobacterales bacterium]
MIELRGGEIAAAIGARVAREGGRGFPGRAEIDSRAVRPGDLFFGLRGTSADGSRFAPEALGSGAWGAVVSEGREPASEMPGWVFAVADPLAALAGLAREWRRRLGCRVVGVTGSVGKTSVKDIAAAVLPGRVHASEENRNTEIGLPLSILCAQGGTEAMVLEMAMRGPGQIAELTRIAEPDVAVITNVGPVHVELLGSVEAVAAAKAEILALPPEGVAVVPAEAGPLEPHLEAAPRLLRFGEGGDVSASEVRPEGGGISAMITTPAERRRVTFGFPEHHNLTNALAAIAAGVAIGATLAEMSARTADIGFSRLRGERLELGEGIVLVNDCYNANPISMRAALDHLAASPARRRIAVVGEMAELGPDAPYYHREVGEHARAAGIDLVVGVGAAAREFGPDELVASPQEAVQLLSERLEPGDLVLVKGSRSVGLEAVAEGFSASREGGA